MSFRKKRSRHFWVFSTYSVVFHFVGFLALTVLIGTHPPDSASSPITVRLVDTMPEISEFFETTHMPPIPSIPQEPKPETLVKAQKPSIPSLEIFPDLFHMIRPVDTSSSATRQVSVATKRRPPSIAQIASTALNPEEFAQTISRVHRVSDLAHSSTRILVDHKAGQSLAATTPPKILFNPIPLYPRIAREMGLEGQTLLRVEILQDGRPGMVKVRESCGHTMLDEAAAKAIKKWKFTPAQDGLFAVRSVVDLPIRFSLNSLG